MHYMTIIEEDCVRNRRVRLRNGEIEYLLRWAPSSTMPVICTASSAFDKSQSVSTRSYNVSGQLIPFDVTQKDIVEFDNDPRPVSEKTKIRITPADCAEKRRVRLRNGTILTLRDIYSTADGHRKVQSRDLRIGAFHEHLLDGRAHEELNASDWDIMEFVETKEKMK